MKIYVVLLMGIAVLLSACSGGLQSEQLTLEPQRVDSCTYQGAVFRSGNALAWDTSANCTVIKDGYDYVSAYSALERSSSENGTYTTVASTSQTTIPPRSYQTYSVNFSHIGSERYCNVAGTGWHRARMTVLWRNANGVLGDATVYRTPKKYGLCG